MSFSDKRPTKANFIGRFDLKSVSIQLSHEGITFENERLFITLRDMIFIMILHFNQDIIRSCILLRFMLYQNIVLYFLEFITLKIYSFHKSKAFTVSLRSIKS